MQKLQFSHAAMPRYNMVLARHRSNFLLWNETFSHFNSALSSSQQLSNCVISRWIALVPHNSLSLMPAYTRWIASEYLQHHLRLVCWKQHFNVVKATPLLSNAINEISALTFLDMGTYSGPKLFPTIKILVKGLLVPICILAPLGLLIPESVYCNSHVCLQLLLYGTKSSGAVMYPTHHAQWDPS